MGRSIGGRSAARFAVVLAGAGALQGCAEAGLGMALFGASAGVAAQTGVSHTLNGIAYKTFTSPMPEVEASATHALDAMGFAIETSTGTESGHKIVAVGEARVIEIELERLSPQATRMRVTAIQNIPLLRDAATGTELIVQATKQIDEWRERAAARKLAAELAAARKTAPTKAVSRKSEKK